MPDAFIVIAWFFGFIIFFVIAFVVTASVSASSKETALALLVSDLVTTHKSALASQRLMLVNKDAYGIENTKRWDKELKLFAEAVVMPKAEPGSRKISARLLQVVRNHVDLIVLPEAQQLADSLSFDPAMSPAMFEKWCAAKLEEFGWVARVSGQSGDQGADVIAERDGMRGVVQCKLYSKPVGNKAVQEVHSARTHYGASFAAVVTNAGYTPSAKALAASTRVHLLHYGDLQRLVVLLGIESSLSG